MIVVREMDPGRVTEREGRWHLRHVILEDDDGVEEGDVHAFLTSDRAPAGTAAHDLVPLRVEFLGLESDEFAIPVAAFARIAEWPPVHVVSVRPESEGEA